MMIACLEEIAWRNGWLSDEDLNVRAKVLGKTNYGAYLLKLINR
jgi:glucose-1-phosphate thymidylyltransferase